jgi:signal recognition particle subunit SRP54
MLNALTQKFQQVFASLRGKKTLTEKNIADAVQEVRSALLDADVNFSVVEQFVQRIKEKAVGGERLREVDPGHQFIHFVHEELVALMGGSEGGLDLGGKLSVVMVCGLQGSGKTTSCAKLAHYIARTEKQKKILLVACDLQRPAAVEQLQKLALEVGVGFFMCEGERDPLRVARLAQEKAKSEGIDVLIVDTAGRLHLDEPLMEELSRLQTLLMPREVLFVANAMMGQDAVQTAAAFDQRVAITGTILTMLDGNARAGAALSIREVTKKPLKFEGVGERVADLRLFHPRSMADRILGMGDVIHLVEKAKEHFDAEEKAALEAKIRKGIFTYADFLIQMRKMRKMGPLQSILGMLPGLGGLGNLAGSDQEMQRMEAMILSMTPGEREERDELSQLRRRRIAKGSGLDLEEINRMAKNFKRMKQFLKDFSGMKGKLPMKLPGMGTGSRPFGL